LTFAPLTTVYDFPAEAKPEYISYSKGVQTSDPLPAVRDDTELGSLSEDEASSSPTRTRKRLSRRERERDEELRQNLRQEIEEELRALQLKEEAPKPQGKENFPARSLTHEELNAVTGSEDFLEFIDRSSKVIERALDEEYDVLADYALRGVNVADDEDDGILRGRKGRRVREVHQFHNDKLTKRRMNSDLDYSPKASATLILSIGRWLTCRSVS